MTINTFFKKNNWEREKNYFWRGFAFWEGKKIPKLSEDFCHLREFFQEQDSNKIISILEKLNGFFAFLYVSNDRKEVFAVVDKMASIPLFWSIEQDTLVFSDSGYCSKNIEKNISFNNTKEFLCLGYVSGDRTLLKNVSRLQAGHYLHAQANDSKWNVTVERYWGYLPEEDSSASKGELLEEQDDMLNRIIDNLISFADGRQIALSLSGGFDSRVIALMLKRKKYDNVLTFSYGAEKNKDALVAKEYANVLHYPWEFIRYDLKDWRNLRCNETFCKYGKYAFNFSTFWGSQDFMAIAKLKQKGKIFEDAVIVNGQSADVQTGEKSKEASSLYFDNLFFDISHIVREVLINNYNLWGNVWEDAELNNLFSYFIQVSLGNLNKYASMSAAYEYWEMQERQSKRVIKAGVDVYEFMGHDWWLPFFDNDFFTYWRKIPLSYKRTRNLYKDYIVLLVSKIMKLGNADFALLRNDIDLKSQLKNRLINHVSHSRYATLAKVIWRQFNIKNEYKQDSLGRSGFFPRKYYLNMRKYSRGYEALVALTCLKRVFNLENADFNAEKDLELLRTFLKQNS